MKYPLLSFGAGIDDPAAFELSEFRVRPSFLTNKFKTFAANFDWDVADRFSLLGGGFFRQFAFDTIGYRRDSSYCAAFTCPPGPNGLPVTADIAELFESGHAGHPSGNSNAYVLHHLHAAPPLVDISGRPPVPPTGETHSHTHKAHSG